jgi:hypothetical protein
MKLHYREEQCITQIRRSLLILSLSQLYNVGGNLDLRGVYERGSVMLIKGEKIVEPRP